MGFVSTAPMRALIAESWLSWLTDPGPTLWTSLGLAVLAFAGSIVVVMVILVKLPPDYFARSQEPWSNRNTSNMALRILKNLLGAALVIAGVAMLFLPGQGILTLLIGVMLLDFPGKRRLELALVRRPGVLGAINRLRACFGKEPLVFAPQVRAS